MTDKPRNGFSKVTSLKRVQDRRRESVVGDAHGPSPFGAFWVSLRLPSCHCTGADMLARQISTRFHWPRMGSVFYFSSNKCTYDDKLGSRDRGVDRVAGVSVPGSDWRRARRRAVSASLCSSVCGTASRAVGTRFRSIEPPANENERERWRVRFWRGMCAYDTTFSFSRLFHAVLGRYVKSQIVKRQLVGRMRQFNCTWNWLLVICHF